MNSDLERELGPLDPGIGLFIDALTAGPETRELTGEQAALVMFREHRFRESSRPAGRAARISARWTLRLVGATALTLAGGLTAAAYANVLPAPVQHVVHVALAFADVPDSHHPRQRQVPPVHHSSRPAAAPTNTPVAASPAPSGHPPASPQPSASSSGSPSPSPRASPSASPPAGAAQLSVNPPDSPIPAGSTVVIDGQLTIGGKGLAGATVTLLERHSRLGAWRVAAIATTNTRGSFAVTSPVLITNTAFRVTGPEGVRSATVRVTVRPIISAVLQLGAGGRRDILLVSTVYAHRGNIAVLQVETKTGAWAALRARVLNVNGKTRFALNAVKLQNRMLRVVLRSTGRHAAAISGSITVPPPA